MVKKKSHLEASDVILDHGEVLVLHRGADLHERRARVDELEGNLGGINATCNNECVSHVFLIERCHCVSKSRHNVKEKRECRG